MKKAFPLILLFFTNILFAQIPCSTGTSLNGADDFITLVNTDAINLQNTRNKTIELWFKTSDITTKQVLYEEGGTVNAFIIYLEGGRIYLGAYRNAGTAAADKRFFRSVASVIEVDNWYHVALTLEDTAIPDLTLKWYLNGVLQDTQDGLQVNTHSGSITFGRNGDGLRFPNSLVDVDWSASGGEDSETYNGAFTGGDTTALYYSGDISLFRIWDDTRTAAEVDDNKSTFLTNETNLVAYADQDRIYYVPDGETEISLTAFVSISTQYTTIPNTDAINLQNTNDRTVEFRFRATDMTSRQVLYEEGGNVNAITAFIDGGQFYFGVYRNNAGVTGDRKFFRSDIGDVVFNQWYHVAITLESGTTLKWFLDGIEQDSRTGLTVDNHSGDINIGRSGGSIRFPNDLVLGWNAGTVGGEYYEDAVNSDGSAYNFSGDFDLFRIWNVARTQTEIDTNKEILITSETDLVAYQSGTQMNYQPNGGSSITATEDAAGLITWDGSDSDVWSTTTNWLSDTAPDATRKQKVAIPDGGTFDPVLTTEISVGFLTINSGVELIIESGATLNVYYGLDNNGTITIEDGGALIYHNCNSAITGSGTFDVIRNTPTYGDDNFFSYWSSPVIGETTSSVFPDAEEIYLFDASSDDANWIGAGGIMQKGVGYAIQNEGTGGQVRTFTGTINEAGTDLTLYFSTNEDQGETGNIWSEEGDNLIGNPYASAIDWSLIIEDTDNQNIEGTIYFWNQQSANVGDNNVSDYLQYNNTGGSSPGVTGKIGTAQAFFVKTTAATTLKLKPTHQVAGDNAEFYKSEKTTVAANKLGRSWFQFSNGNKINTLLIGFVDGATNDYDRIYDGLFDINQEKLGFYSIAEEDTRLTIQGLPLLEEDEKVIQLGFVIDEKGEHTISIKDEYINEDYNIYLEDTEENTITDLRKQSYSFSINTIGTNNTRFKIIYSKEKKETLTINDEVLKDNSFFVSVNSSKELIINYKNLDQIKKVTLYTILGSEVKSYSINDSKDVSNLETGVYIVKASLDNNKKRIKKIVITN
ncbi:LamG-like jellyroll fold domain-containing protein [uncultured Polaribacter sp.]|uniref:LamG-like jellyroll fold domain-containing protein n=1 Tax=uncultured Polaribacter sp. TaxID=174711 RepID=UPI0026271DD8|nr:LamG-like jellyroll fold domain-containing protein [uncultured Polaribacter sp.]